MEMAVDMTISCVVFSCVTMVIMGIKMKDMDAMSILFVAWNGMTTVDKGGHDEERGSP